MNEHMNAVVKKLFTNHTNDQVDVDNINNSKFSQVLARVACKRLRTDDLEVEQLRKAHPCAACTEAGIDISDPNDMHYRKSSKKCKFNVRLDTEGRRSRGQKRGREIVRIGASD